MYHIYGIEENIKNCYRAVYPFISDPHHVQSISDLRNPYLNFLKNQQPDYPINFDHNPFIFDEEVEKLLAKAYSEGSLDDLRQSELIGKSYSRKEKNNKIYIAVQALNSLFEQDENLAALFSLVIHSIFTKQYDRKNGSKGTHGGSSSGAIGVIWLTINKSITRLDLMELFLHELTHHLVFIDELNYPQFSYKEIKKPENYSYSAILNMQRPLDKVVHSIIVATEIILARKTILNIDEERTVHPSTEKMLDSIFQSFESINNLKNKNIVLKPRTFEILNKCIEKVNSL